MNELNPIHFVTGKLAEHALREVVRTLADRYQFSFTIDVLPITVAALMTPRWLLKHIQVPDSSKRVILPGYLQDGLEEIRSALAIDALIECGPKDLRDLPQMFGEQGKLDDDFGLHAIEVIAELNHAPRLALAQLIAEAEQLVAQGADRIDLGATPGFYWKDVGLAVRELTSRGIKISIDSFDPNEVEQATIEGADLVLSVNESNCHRAKNWGAEVVVIPSDLNESLPSLQRSIDRLNADSVPFRIDPILEPIGCGFSASLGRYLDTRRAFPQAPMMMGIGNLTELTDVDSAGINLLLLGFCEEQSIRSVLTTQVIPWAQSSVRECAIARELTHYAVKHHIPPKRLGSELVMLRDPKIRSYSEQAIERIAHQIKDTNFRLYVSSGIIHLVSAGVHLRGTDPYALMDELMQTEPGKNLDASHAFYIGFELHKALTALTLGKNYEQDESLDWGFLTRREGHRRLARKKLRPESG